MNDNDQRNKVLAALKVIDVAALSYQEWVNVGMALKHEGFPCSIWDDWSRNDKRYKSGACDKKWGTFEGGGVSPITAATIIKMAQDRGWQHFDGNELLDWNDSIEYDGDDGFTGFTQNAGKSTDDLRIYLETLFEPDDVVAYVTNDVWEQEGKWMPSKGIYTRKCKDILDELKKHPDDISAAIGDYNQQAGAWIRFNPFDGKGVKNDNVTAYRYALVESDTLSIPEQNALFRKMELPIAVMVHSGGKSLHAIVHIDADNYEEYRKRVDFLYDFLEKNGITIDKQNRNPSRLSRMPGVIRNGNRQYLVGTNIGRKSWLNWMDFAEGIQDELPEIVSLSEIIANPPPLAEELITGILRRGHKMLISGSSKAGKSFILMELCIAISEGIDWLGFKCKKGRVLYVNLEIDQASCANRLMTIRNELEKRQGLICEHYEDLMVWNLRGYAVPLDQLVPKLIRRAQPLNLDAIIIDPIYKVITGDENNASDMGAFCNQFDVIATKLGCSVIYCHHHSKGSQGAKKAMDRASGSGVFARDPDAQLDMIEVELDDATRNAYMDSGVTAWRLESSLREFPNIKPVNIWFDYPLHEVDRSGVLSNLPVQGETGRNGNDRNTQRRESANQEFRNAFDALGQYDSGTEGVPVKELANYLGKQQNAVYTRVKSLPDEFEIKRGIVHRKNGTQMEIGVDNW